MGTFDYVVFNGFKHAQLKTWDRMMRTYHVGDPVPITNTNPHSIKTEEGYGWVNVKDRCIESLTDEPFYDEMYDKWGTLLNDANDKTDLNNPVVQALIAFKKEQPYIPKTVTTYVWNPDYPQEEKCTKCNHPYYRHFDSYDDMLDIGCKYCACYKFTNRVDNENL